MLIPRPSTSAGWRATVARRENPVVAAFDDARADDRALLIGYWPAGYPDQSSSIEIMKAMVAGGVDMMEIGIPYSDPLMDGPVIATAVAEALRQGTTPRDALRAVVEVASTGAPTLVMTYWNLIERYGASAFAEDLAASGGVGVIAPDLTVEEAGSWISDTDSVGVSRVFLAAPSSVDDRLDIVTRACNGFVYAASLMGVTGTRENVSQDARNLVERLRRRTRLPIAVGLGVSTPQQAAEVARYADGVIVGSAFLRHMGESRDLEDVKRRVRSFAADLAAGVRRGSEDNGDR